jgi:outer membrane protein OmpA-like peptidoglycan-associated protein
MISRIFFSLSLILFSSCTATPGPDKTLGAAVDAAWGAGPKIQSKPDYARNGNNSGAAYTIYFDTDVTSLRSGSISLLETIADAIKASPHACSILVIGHSDDSGTAEYNLQVAEARAQSVAASLETRGVATDQVKIVSAGSRKPVATSTTPEGRQLNRRVEIIVK